MRAKGRRPGAYLAGEGSCGSTGEDVGEDGKPRESVKQVMTESDLRSTGHVTNCCLESGPQGTGWTEGLGGRGQIQGELLEGQHVVQGQVAIAGTGRGAVEMKRSGERSRCILEVAQ